MHTKELSLKKIKQLRQTLDGLVKALDIPSKEQQVVELELDSADTDFWSDQARAKEVMQTLEKLKKEVSSIKQLETDLSSLEELYDSVQKHERQLLLPDFQSIERRLQEFEIRKYLSGRFDTADVFLSIHAGQGGTEANDWTAMLARMYERYFERKGWKFTVTHKVAGSETGYGSIEYKVLGEYLFGLLKREQGAHRLVRLSPFNSANLRQTSFAGVEIVPIIDDVEVDIKDSDLEIKAVRSGGAGGQHVNKTSSAVQIRHIPTGITVHNSEQRSQAQNKQTALKILKAKLWLLEEQKREDELRQARGEHKIAGWGNQIRNYILHPYKLVKDLRTNVESHNPDEVLDGDLDMFIEAEVRL